MKFVRATKMDQVLSLLSNDKWQILSGGTDFYPGLRDQSVTGNVLDISDLNELKGIECSGDFWRIGALVTWTDIIKADLPAAFNTLKLAAREIGSVQIQNRGTVVGNLSNASPAADGVPPLLVLDARVELQSSAGTRQLGLLDFVLGNRKTALRKDEVISAILIPRDLDQSHSTFLKLGTRTYLVISISMAAVRLNCDANHQITEAMVSVGSCSEVAQRLKALESRLIGQSVADDLSKLVTPEFLNLLSPIDDVRASASYRQIAALQLVKRAIMKTAKELL